MNPRPRTLRSLATITGVPHQVVVPAASGYAYAISQICLHNEQGNIRSVTLYEDHEEFFTYTVGASGTIIQDMDREEQFGIGSGIHASLDVGGAIKVLVRYIKYDERTPTNLDGATYVPTTTRRPNIRGAQQEG